MIAQREVPIQNLFSGFVCFHFNAWLRRHMQKPNITIHLALAACCRARHDYSVDRAPAFLRRHDILQSHKPMIGVTGRCDPHRRRGGEMLGATSAGLSTENPLVRGSGKRL
jgi:hypothetical protein